MNLTKLYPFSAMTVGSSFVVYSRFQHARVAASEYGRKHGMCFTCRMEEDNGNGRTMRVHRIELDQTTVDQRGRNGKREIVTPEVDHPTESEYLGWLATLTGTYNMPLSYQARYPEMMLWTSQYNDRTGRFVTAGLWHDGSLMITRIA